MWLSLGLIIGLGVAGLMPFSAAAQEPVPTFEDFPVVEIYQGATAPLDLADNPTAQAYRTRLTEAAREKPNFAGHYIIAAWGCGAACVEGGIIDAQQQYHSGRNPGRRLRMGRNQWRPDMLESF